MAGQLKSFLDATGGLWATGALVGKVGSFFTSSATQHGGNETTIISSIPGSYFYTIFGNNHYNFI